MKKKFTRTRKLRDEETDTEGTWAISYGDMVTLLLTFFILFFSLNPDSKAQAEKEKHNADEAQGKALQAALIKALEGLATIKNEDPKEAPTKELNESTTGVLYKKDQKVILDFPGVSFFNSGQIPLTIKGKNTLQKFSEKYSSYMGNFQISIHAYADTKKVRDNPNNRFTDNLELSALRGIAAMRFLQSAGIPLNRMRVAGYGELQLTMTDLSTLEVNEQTAANLLNLARRVVLVIEPGERSL